MQLNGVRATRWAQTYSSTPLAETAAHFRALTGAHFLAEWLQTARKYCPDGVRTLETGVGTGYGTIMLSHWGCQAEGIGSSRGILERARQVNLLVGGDATFRVGDLFDLDGAVSGQRYSVIHHQGVLEHFTLPQVRAALAQQFAGAG